MQPYLDAFPLPNGANLGGGLAAFSFPFTQEVGQDFFQARLDHQASERGQVFRAGDAVAQMNKGPDSSQGAEFKAKREQSLAK